MSRKEIEGRGAPGLGKRAGRKPGPHDDQRDPEQDVQHMPRHWQAPGTRGEEPGQPAPGPDERELARGNQYGEAGRAASRQIHEELTEHGREAPPQRRDNDQLPKRAGEREDQLPTPDKGRGA